MERMDISEMRSRIGEHLAEAIGVSSKEKDSKKFGAAVRLFVEEKLHLEIKNDGSHKTYGPYSDRSAHNALRKIFEGKPPFPAGAKRESLCIFEDALIDYIIRENIFENHNIPGNLFRSAKSGNYSESFAQYRYIRKADTQAEYLCRRFLDKFSSSKQNIIDLKSEDNCGILLFAIVEPISEDNKSYNSVIYTDVFDQKLIEPEDLISRNMKWKFSRISPPGKPIISETSAIRDLKRVYVPDSNTEKFKNRHISLQALSHKKILNFLSKNLFHSTIKINQVFSSGLYSGPLKRVVFDVEIGAVIAGQIDQGRFWFFAFCPVESKVRQSDAMLIDKVVGHYEAAIRKR